ncbi:hypothetical protein [Sphingomonas adhaesiva]|uniref:hypothetical protein n=1 Tax=Sphingomonas adhaesiva TaxID=28212 RepID=UPI002FF7ADA2
MSARAISWIRARVARLTVGSPRKARETVGCDTPARSAMSNDVILPCCAIAPSCDGRSTIDVSAIIRSC